MKIIVTFILTAAVYCLITARTNDIGTTIIKNKLGAGANAGYTFYSGDDTDPETSFTLPLAVWSFESLQKGAYKYYADGSAGFRMSKRTEEFASDLFADLDQEIRVYLPEKKVAVKKRNDEWNEEDDPEKENLIKDKGLSGRYFYSLMLPFEFHYYTPDQKDASSFSAYTAEIAGGFGLDNRKKDIKKLSPWAKFEKGYFATGYLSYRFADKFDSYSPERSPFFIGAFGDYSKDLTSIAKNFNVKGYCKLAVQLVSDAEIVLPAYYTRSNPYRGKWAELEYGIRASHDMFSKLNLLSTLDLKTVQLDDDDKNRINTVSFSAGVNYYPRPFINVYGTFGVGAHLKEDGTEPAYSFIAGAEYTLDFLNK